MTIRNLAACGTFMTRVLNEASCHEPGHASTFSAFLPAAKQGWEVQAISIDPLVGEACSFWPRGRVPLTATTTRRRGHWERGGSFALT